MSVTYAAKSKIEGPILECKRCKRQHPYPAADHVVRCECGWWYRNVEGKLVDEFRPRLSWRAPAGQ